MNQSDAAGAISGLGGNKLMSRLSQFTAKVPLRSRKFIKDLYY